LTFFDGQLMSTRNPESQDSGDMVQSLVQSLGRELFPACRPTLL
jgi:hypothetical protein